MKRCNFWELVELTFFVELIPIIAISVVLIVTPSALADVGGKAFHMGSLGI